MIKRVLLDREFVSRARFPEMYVAETLKDAGFDMEAPMRATRPGWLFGDMVLIVQDSPEDE